MLCPNCSARLDADGTCHKCWWRPPKVERARRTFVILLPPIALAFSAVCFTFLALQDGTTPRWTAAVCIWLAAVVAIAIAVSRIRSQSTAGGSDEPA
jgi:hypothetical protein